MVVKGCRCWKSQEGAGEGQFPTAGEPADRLSAAYELITPYGKKQPFAITADKDKAKKRSITFCSMQKPPNVDYTVRFVQRFFASHPSATDVTGRGLAQLVIHELQSKLGLTLQSLKQFSSMCGDGQYLKNNVCEHMETELENHLDELVLLLAGTWHKTSTRCSSQC